mmetsp:Transcript_10929/g.26872  ORF Transcript_10929/g.26872 Transcript_10929/m.26872 type:complete len:371 (-) Transcript_10929:448-1560(-)
MPAAHCQSTPAACARLPCSEQAKRLLGRGGRHRGRRGCCRLGLLLLTPPAHQAPPGHALAHRADGGAHRRPDLLHAHAFAPDLQRGHRGDDGPHEDAAQVAARLDAAQRAAAPRLVALPLALVDLLQRLLEQQRAQRQQVRVLAVERLRGAPLVAALGPEHGRVAAVELLVDVVGRDHEEGRRGGGLVHQARALHGVALKLEHVDLIADAGQHGVGELGGHVIAVRRRLAYGHGVGLGHDGHERHVAPHLVHHLEVNRAQPVGWQHEQAHVHARVLHLAQVVLAVAALLHAQPLDVLVLDERHQVLDRLVYVQVVAVAGRVLDLVHPDDAVLLVAPGDGGAQRLGVLEELLGGRVAAVMHLQALPGCGHE